MTQSVRIGWRPYVNVVTQVVNAVDADATAFITAAGITNLTQAAAINTLVNDLKTYGLWTKMKALYPMVGGSATSHKFNLKDPRDLDTAFRLAFTVTGWTHTSTGAKPNGTSAYANTFLNESTTLLNNNSHISFYSRTDLDSTSCDIGVTTGLIESNIYSKIGSIFYPRIQANNGGVNVGIVSSQAFYLSNRVNSSQVFGYRNTTKYILSSNSSGRINSVFYLAANYKDGVAQHLSSREQAFASIGDGLTDTEATNFYNSVQKFQTTLGRQIGSPIVSDTDAQAFINAAGLTDLGQANAVNTLVVDLKAAGVWTKMKALYPMVGGTATTHKWNLKDPRDVDAAFRLMFNGGWTHNASGAQSNGTTGYADPKMPANQIFTSTNGLMGVYTSSTSSNAGGYMYGVSNMGSSEWSMYYTSGGNLGFGMYGTNTLSSASTLQGLSAIGMETNGYRSIYKNNSRLISSNNGFVAMTQNFNMFLAARNAGGGGVDGFASLLYSFSFISSTLTLTEYSAFYTAVQKYQTSLGRQVGTPVLASGQTAGLLDTYSSATVAYSLRKLRNGYYGFAIRVRRSSDNAEQDIAFNTSGGLDTTSLLAFVGSGNGFVTTWYDQSGNNNNALNTTAASQPQIVSSGSLITSSGGIVSLSCQNKNLSNSMTNTLTHTQFIGMECSTTGNSALFGLPFTSLVGAPNGDKYSGIAQPGSSSSPAQYFGSPSYYVNNTLISATRAALYSNTVTSTKKLVNITSTSVGSTVSSRQLQYEGYTGNYKVFEVIIYNTDQSSNITTINNNINSYYSIY